MSLKTVAQFTSGGGGGSGTVTSVNVSGGTTGLTTSGGPVTTSGTITIAGTLAVANGGTGVTASTGASSVALRDANVNLTVNSIFEGFTSVAAAGTTTTLTASSAPTYLVTGSGGQTFQLPDATTLPAGAIFSFNNNQTSGTVVVKNNTGTTLVTLQSGSFVDVTLLVNSPAAGSWDTHAQAPSNVSWSTNTLDWAGSITSSTWNGVTVAANRGGTGIASYTIGDLIYASGTTTLATLADVATGNALISGGVATAPSWGKINLTTHISGTLPVANGGTGQSTALTQYGVIYGASTTAMGNTAAGTTGQVLIGNTGAAPSWANISTSLVSSISFGSTGLTPATATTGAVTVAGTLAVANGGTGVTTSTGTGNVVLSASPTLSGTISFPSSTTINSSGNIGVGTTSPNFSMQVNSASSVFTQYTNSTTGSTSGVGTLIGVTSGGDTYVWNQSNYNIIFGTNNGERMRVDSSGNLLMGGTSQPNSTYSSKLVVNAGSNYCATYYSSVNPGSYSPLVFLGTAYALAGYVNVSGTVTTYNSVSDYRLKVDVVPMEGGLAKINTLRPVTYRWLVDGSDGEGFIAHELQSVVPFAVTGEKDAVNKDGSIKPQGIDMAKVIPHLVAAIQELSDKNNELAARIAALEVK